MTRFRVPPCFIALACLAALSPAWAQPAQTIDAIIALERPVSAVISPDGTTVACTVSVVNWDTDAYATQIRLIDVRNGASRTLTTTPRSGGGPAWSPDGKRLAVVAEAEAGARLQIVVFDVATGARSTVTQSPTGIDSFAWSPTGDRIAYAAADPPSAAIAARDKVYGRFAIADQDPPRSHIWVTGVTSGTPRRLTSGPYSVGRLTWSPDGTSLAFDHKWTSISAADTHESDLSIVTVADGVVRNLVVRPGPDAAPIWSPDGTRIAFYTGSGDPEFDWNKNWTFATVAATGGTITPIATNVDELLIPAGWSREGFYFRSNHGPWAYLSRVDPSTGAVTRLAPDGQWTMRQNSFSADFRTTAFVASRVAEFVEVYVADVGGTPRKLTDFGAQIRHWPANTREMVEWPSGDGTTIDGVLHKPANFDPTRRYPLLIAIHGGPTSVSRPAPFDDTSYGPYPIDLWLAKGAVVLQPNYRGSLGRGQAFKSLLIGNISAGESQDVVAGIDALVQRGIADPARIGVMGWSYGGLLSAYLIGQIPSRLKAASVGAGVTDWRTNYGNTDLPGHARHYQGSTPWERPDVWAKASPITHIGNARVPTLIQHGEADPRVPVANARNLYRALQDLGVESRLVLFRGAGHILPSPRMLKAAMQQNYDWFNHFIWNDPLPAPLTGAW